MTRRIALRQTEVPYLTKQFIERDALALLTEYGEAFGPIIKPPVPIDEIIELQLQLTLEIQDLTRLFGVGDVHGAIWFNENRVAVDALLDPDCFPSKIGRYRFTLAHEAGHERLHRLLFLADPNQASLLDETTNSPSYICRSSESRKPVEWQADQYAAALLMPREMVRHEWHEWRGSDEPITWSEVWQFEHDISEPPVFDASAGVSPFLESFCRPFADRFEVSAAAMRIRLEDMDLLVREKEPMLF